MEDPQIELHQASNVAWHIRTNGADQVTPENLQLLCRVVERLADREEYIRILFREISALPRRTRESKALEGVLQAVDLATGLAKP
jgi:hypothetical protein